ENTLNDYLTIDAHQEFFRLGGYPHSEFLPLPLSQARKGLGRLACDRGHLLIATAVLASPSLDLRVVQEVGNEQTKAFALLDDDALIVRFSLAVRSSNTLLQHLREHADRCEGRLQLV